MKIKSFLLDGLALFAGAMLTLAFAPFKLFPLAIISPALLLCTWLHASPKRAFWRGWLFGVGLFGTGVYWIFHSVYVFGSTSLFFAGSITSALIAVLAFFPALNGFLLNRYFPSDNNAKILCAFPVIWVFLEWIRSWLFTGFPWLTIGYSQIHSPLKGYAPVFSVYGISLAVLLTSSFLVSIIIKYREKQRSDVYLNVIAIALIWIIGGVLTLKAWTKPTGEPIQISLIQGNVAQDVKWSPDHVQPTLDLYEKLTSEHWDSKIIIWPESAIPLPFLNAAKFLGSMSGQASLHDSTLITGIPIQIPGKEEYLNSVITLGQGQGFYSKHRLVPFGEYIPLKNILGRVMDLLHVPMSDFIADKRIPEPLIANGVKIATFICYEIAFPEQVLSRDGTIDMILTVSNDAWFGRSIAQAQHLQMAQMRALEMGRPLLFVANDGITAFVNSHGNILAIAPQYESFVLTESIVKMEGRTPWQRFAMDPVLLLLIALLVIGIPRRNLPC